MTAAFSPAQQLLLHSITAQGVSLWGIPVATAPSGGALAQSLAADTYHSMACQCLVWDFRLKTLGLAGSPMLQVVMATLVTPDGSPRPRTLVFRVIYPWRTRRPIAGWQGRHMALEHSRRCGLSQCHLDSTSPAPSPKGLDIIN